MTGEQARWGFENLALDQKKLDALGFAGVMRPISTTCADHMGADLGAHPHLGRQRSGTSRSDWYEADESIIKPMVKAAADKYAAEKKITPTHAGRLPVLSASADRLRIRHDALPFPSLQSGGVRAPRAPPGGARLLTEPSSKRRVRRFDEFEGHGMSNILLNVNGIEVIYNHVILVLKGVSLQVPEGGVVALLGGNGAGKTTTLRAVSNLLARRARRGHQGHRSSCAASASRSSSTSRDGATAA